MRIRIDPHRVKGILRFVEEKDLFVSELISAINKSIEKENPELIEDCLQEWEASAELNSIPGLAERVRKRYQSLVESGLIDG
jgi:hypothetical protein